MFVLFFMKWTDLYEMLSFRCDRPGEGMEIIGEFVNFFPV